MSPIMYGVPTSGQPYAETPHVSDSAQGLISSQAAQKMASEQVIETPKDEKTEAIEKYNEAVKLLEEAKSEEDKQTASELVQFWGDRVKELTPELKEEKPKENSKKYVELPDIYTRIHESSTKRIIRKTKKEKKPAKKVTYLI